MRGQRPDLVVSDIVMPGMDGLGLLAAVRADPVIAATPFLFLTGRTDYEHLRRAMNAGADDYLVKPYAAADLIGAVCMRLQRLAMPADPAASPAPLPASLSAERLDSLSPREREVLALIAQGMSSQQIADQLAVSRRTVDSHRVHILDKLGFDNPNDLIRLAGVLVIRV
jgi:NarL family two-component system response regulator LiaR